MQTLYEYNKVVNELFIQISKAQIEELKALSAHELYETFDKVIHSNSWNGNADGEAVIEQRKFYLNIFIYILSILLFLIHFMFSNKKSGILAIDRCFNHRNIKMAIFSSTVSKYNLKS